MPTNSSKLKKKIWKLFSRCIRLTDSVNGYSSCVTCGTVKPIEELHAGHYIHGNTKKTYFDERNVHPQCVSCNMYKSGSLDKYALYLERVYGNGILQVLNTLSKQRYTRNELDDLLIYYKEKLNM